MTHSYEHDPKSESFGLEAVEKLRLDPACVIDPVGVVAWSATYPEEVNPGVDGVLSALEAIADPGRSVLAS